MTAHDDSGEFELRILEVRGGEPELEAMAAVASRAQARRTVIEELCRRFGVKKLLLYPAVRTGRDGPELIAAVRFRDPATRGEAADYERRVDFAASLDIEASLDALVVDYDGEKDFSLAWVAPYLTPPYREEIGPSAT